MSLDWTIEVEDSSGNWVNDGYIYRPNEDIETNITSTMTPFKLADGSYGFINPETKKVKESFNMFFANTTSDFRSQIEGYMENGDKVRITTHTSEIFIGKFTVMKRVWFTGIEPDSYDLQVTFTITE